MGGVGIVRVSGPLTPVVAKGLIGRVPEPRLATLAGFCARDDKVIRPGHRPVLSRPQVLHRRGCPGTAGTRGSGVILDLLLQRALELGTRPARPGEFSELAFLNGKLDLAQAEAVADLIESTTEVAARLAGPTLQGELSRRVEGLLEGIVRLRSFVEAAIDVPVRKSTSSPIHKSKPIYGT